MGKAIDKGPQPLWVVAASLARHPQARQKEFSRLAFHQIKTVGNTQIISEQPLQTNLFRGHLLEGTGRDEKTGSDLYLFQAVLVDSQEKYYRLVGVVPAGQKEVFRPEFLRLMNTLQPREPARDSNQIIEALD